MMKYGSHGSHGKKSKGGQWSKAPTEGGGMVSEVSPQHINMGGYDDKDQMRSMVNNDRRVGFLWGQTPGSKK